MASQVVDFSTGRKAKYVGGKFVPEGMEIPVVVGGDKTIATTGNSDLVVIVPFAGVLTLAYFGAEDALATDDTNYVTFSITNKGQSGAGSTALLAASNGNTTKATGGSAIAAYTKRSLSLHGTAANLVVAQGDTLLIRFAATGTLAGAVDRCAVTLLIRRTA